MTEYAIKDRIIGLRKLRGVQYELNRILVRSVEFVTQRYHLHLISLFSVVAV